MTPDLIITQAAERLTGILLCYNAASPPIAFIIIDEKAYLAVQTSGAPYGTLYAFTYDVSLERGPHIIYAQATDSAGTVTMAPITYVMAYELTEYGIDLYSGEAKLDAIEPVLHDELLPALPTLNFSCATLLTGTIQAVIRERGLRKYQFTIDTVAISGPLYVYTCLAAESYVLTSAIMALQTAHGSTADAIRLLVPSLNIVNAQLLSQNTYPQIFQNIEPLEVIKQLLIQSLAQASVRNGNLYAFPLDVAGKKVTFSADIKSSVAGSVAFNATGKYQINVGVQYSTTTTYQRFTMTGSFSHNPKGANGDVCHLSFYGSGVIPTVRNIEIDVDGVQVLVDATEFGGVSGYCFKDITAIAQQNIVPLWYHDPDYHMQRLDPLTGWQRDADIYDAVEAHYTVKQYPTPATFLTLNDKVNWKDVNGANVLVYDVTQVTTGTPPSLLPVPSGAAGMLKSVGNCSRTVSTLFRYFDRIRFNWNPAPSGTTITVSLQDDCSITPNKLEMVHSFVGQIGAGFVLNPYLTWTPIPTDTLTKDITISPIKYVTKVTGTMTGNCQYRVTLLDAGSAPLWQDEWRWTFGNTFEVNVPNDGLASIAQTYQATTVRIEFTSLYLVDGVHYGVQCITCYITVQTWTAVGTHQQVDSNIQYTVPMHLSGSGPNNYTMLTDICLVPTLTGNQTYTATLISAMIDISVMVNGQWQPAGRASAGGSISVTGSTLTWYRDYGPLSSWEILSSSTVRVNVVVSETVQDHAWVSSMFVWSNAFNLFESVDLAFVNFIRTGNPVNLQAIVLTCSGDNYFDSLVLVADNPLPIVVRAGTGSRPFVVQDDFGSEAGAQAYADGLLPIVSVAREQYTLDVPLSTDLSVGDTIDGDGVNYTIRSADYRQDGKTLAAGRSMDILKTQLAEYARRLDGLERKV